MTAMQPSFCRSCLAFCPIEVEVDDGRAIKVVGDATGTPFGGYICPKGRALPELHNNRDRLLWPLKRNGSGSFERISPSAAVEEVAAKVRALVDEYGPDCVAVYNGTGVVSNPTGQVLGVSFLRALGSGMFFSAATIDKPAANTSTALHGNWMAGPQRFEASDTWMIVGGNPVISKSNGAPSHNPGQRLKEAQRRGMKLIVIDPRATETAKRAHIHLQLRPGEDSTLLAAMLRVILTEELEDRSFVLENAEGLETLRKAVEPFTPEFAAARAGISADLLVEAARVFAGGRRGGAVCATGPSFAPRSDLAFYLALCLNTVCGRWGREGELATFQNVLLPPYMPRAQAFPPYPVLGAREMRVRGLRENASGLPTAALADEILMEGPGRIRALFCAGGNPVHSWPDMERTKAALAALDLLVVFDCHMTTSAALADYVIAPPLPLEMPGTTNRGEAQKYSGVSRGYEIPWAQYSKAVARPPAGSELFDEGSFFFRLAQRLGLQLKWVNSAGYGPHVESAASVIDLDMSREPDMEELVALTCAGSRVPLDVVKSYPYGHCFDDLEIIIQPKQEDWPHRLQLADPMMMAELAEAGQAAGVPQAADFPLMLLSRRANNFMNSVGQTLPSLHRGVRHNLIHMHPDDIALLGLETGEIVAVRSQTGTMFGAVVADRTLRAGTVSTFLGFAQLPEDEAGTGALTGSVSALIGLEHHDRLTGMPLMSAIPIRVERVPA